MSSYHVLTTNEKKDRVEVVFHVFVPNINNAAGVNLRTALVEYLEDQRGVSPIATIIPWDIGTELTDIQNGTLYEVRETVRFNAHLPNLEKRDIIDQRFQEVANAEQDNIQHILRFWHMERSLSFSSSSRSESSSSISSESSESSESSSSA